MGLRPHEPMARENTCHTADLLKVRACLTSPERVIRTQPPGSPGAAAVPPPLPHSGGRRTRGFADAMGGENPERNFRTSPVTQHPAECQPLTVPMAGLRGLRLEHLAPSVTREVVVLPITSPGEDQTCNLKSGRY